MTINAFVDAVKYKASEDFIRKLDAEDGGLKGKPVEQQLETIAFALSAGLKDVDNTAGKTNSLWDAYVMVCELYEDLK